MYINEWKVKLWTSYFTEYCRPTDTIENKSLRPTLKWKQGRLSKPWGHFYKEDEADISTCSY